MHIYARGVLLGREEVFSRADVISLSQEREAIYIYAHTPTLPLFCNLELAERAFDGL